MAPDYASTRQNTRAILAAARERRDLEFFKTQSNSSLSYCAGVRDNYNLAKVFLDGPQVDGWELEVSQEIARSAQIQPAGVFVPLNMLVRASPADLSDTTGEGGEIMQTTVDHTLVDVLWNQSVCVALGASVLENLTGQGLNLPRQTTTPAPAWLAENTGTTPFSNSPAFDFIPLRIHRVSSMLVYSKQLLEQSRVGGGIDKIVMRELFRSIGTAIDLAALSGTGGTQPTGILNIISGGSGAITLTEAISFSSGNGWKNVVAMEAAVESTNIQDDSTFGYAVSPLVKQAWKTTPKVTSTAEFIVDRDGRVNTYPMLASNQLAATNQVIFGKWSELILATWGYVDVTSDPFTQAQTNTVIVTVNMLCDIAVRHSNAFCVSTNSGTSI